MSVPGGGYDVTSCMAPCSVQGVWYHFLSSPIFLPVGVWSQGRAGLVSRGRSVLPAGVWSWRGGLVLGEGVCFRGRGFWSGPRGGMALPPGGQTNRCKSITFPQLRLRAVNIYTYFCDDWFAPRSNHGHRYRYHKFFCYNCLGQTDINILYSPKY